MPLASVHSRRMGEIGTKRMASPLIRDAPNKQTKKPIAMPQQSPPSSSPVPSTVSRLFPLSGLIRTPSRLLIVIAIVYRLALICLSLASNALITDYDTSTQVLQRSSNDVDYGESLVATWSRWDAIYFLRFAQVGGYEYEHFHAFFPLYPLLCRWTAVAIRTELSISCCYHCMNAVSDVIGGL